MGRRVGLVLLWGGFLGGALISVLEQDAINWLHYGLAVAVTIVGVVLLRISQRRGLNEGGRVAREIEVIRASLARLDDRLRAFHEGRDDVGVYDVHDRIDEDFMPTIAEFVDARESMIAAYDMDVYAKVMTDFALGERLLNRAWCASADGYIDETWASIERASQALARARKALPDDDPEP